MKAASKMYISYTKEPKEFVQIHFLVFQGMFLSFHWLQVSVIIIMVLVVLGAEYP